MQNFSRGYTMVNGKNSEVQNWPLITEEEIKGGKGY